MAFLSPPWTTRTPHLLSGLNETEIVALEEKYALAKSYGVRGSLALLTGSGYYSFVKELGKGAACYCGRRWLGCSLITISGYLGFGGVPLITNSTKVVGYAKGAHRIFATVMDATETTAGLPLAFVEVAVFGRPVPKAENSTLSMYPNGTDIFTGIPGL